ELGMQGCFDFIDNGRGDRLEVGCDPDVVADPAEQPLGALAITKEPSVEQIEPALAVQTDNDRDGGKSTVLPPSNLQDVGKWQVTIDPQIDEKKEARGRHNRHQHAPRKRVLKPASNDEGDVEQSMAEDRI